jgi:tight adherence protein B
MSSYVVGALPIASLLFMLVGNRSYVMPLFTTDAGHIVLGIGIFMWTLGFMLMKKMTKVKI